MTWTVIILMSILILALPSTAFAEFNGIVYTIQENPIDNQLEVDSQIVSKITDTVKLYDTPYMEQTVMEFSKVGVDVYIGINVLEEHQERLINYVKIAQDYPNVLGIILESDPIDNMTELEIIEIINYIQEKGIMVSVASTPENWNKMDRVLEEVDFVYYYMFSYWNGFSASQSLTKLQLFHEMNLKRYGVESVYELGYPDTGDVIGAANPSPSEQKLFLEGLLEFEGKYVLLSFEDETQKESKFEFPGNEAEKHFGLFNDGKIKYNFNDIVGSEEIPTITHLIPDTTKVSYVPALAKDPSIPKQMQNIMEIEILSENGFIDLYYDDKQKHFEVRKQLKLFLDLDNYDNLEVIADSIDSISFFSVPYALAQCDPGSPTCMYIDEKMDYDSLGYIITASLIILFVFYILLKLKLLSKINYKKQKIKDDENEDNGYFERIITP